MKSEVPSEVYTKDEVKIEVDKVTSDLKKYVEDAIAEHAALFLAQDRGAQCRVKYELTSDEDDEDKASGGEHGLNSNNNGSVAHGRGKHELCTSPALNALLAPPQPPNFAFANPTRFSKVSSVWWRLHLSEIHIQGRNKTLFTRV